MGSAILRNLESLGLTKPTKNEKRENSVWLRLARTKKTLERSPSKWTVEQGQPGAHEKAVQQEEDE